MATIQTQTIVKEEVSRFATYLCAYQQCSEEVRSIVDEMASIVADEESTDDECEHATDALIEALFPALTHDWRESHRRNLASPELREAGEQVKSQEQAFSEKVQGLMDAKELTQDKLAELTGVSQPAISNILTRNCRPQQGTIIRFAQALDVEPTDLWPTFND